MEKCRSASCCNGVCVHGCFLSPLKGQKEVSYSRGKRRRLVVGPQGAVVADVSPVGALAFLRVNRRAARRKERRTWQHLMRLSPTGAVSLPCVPEFGT